MTDLFPDKLIRLRTQKGLTQRDLAAMTGLSWSQISKYESGKSKPRKKALWALEKALDCPDGLASLLDDGHEEKFEPAERLTLKNRLMEALGSVDPSIRQQWAAEAEKRGLDYETYVFRTARTNMLEMSRAAEADGDREGATLLRVMSSALFRHWDESKSPVAEDE